MITVLVLGASGMLGSMVADVFSRDPAVAVSATVRSEALRARAQERLPDVRWRLFDGDRVDGCWLDVLSGHQWIVNCIGVTKPRIRDAIASDLERAIRINAALPYRLASVAAELNARVLQIATDCVYSGTRGAYREEDAHDPLDVYGKTKSLGEVPHDLVHHLRCSIVGPEPKEFKFLLEWFRRQPRGARVKGYVNHLWNGVTTLHFARVSLGVIKAGLNVPAVQHVVPGDAVTKDGLLREFARWYDRADVTIDGVEAAQAVDRRLGTSRPEVNQAIWRAAGYEHPPCVSEMVGEVSRYEYRMGGLA
jgi:dTDP-4-dehydrorhamnose reductase